MRLKFKDIGGVDRSGGDVRTWWHLTKSGVWSTDKTSGDEPRVSPRQTAAYEAGSCTYSEETLPKMQPLTLVRLYVSRFGRRRHGGHCCHRCPTAPSGVSAISAADMPDGVCEILCQPYGTAIVSPDSTWRGHCAPRALRRAPACQSAGPGNSVNSTSETHTTLVELSVLWEGTAHGACGPADGRCRRLRLH